MTVSRWRRLVERADGRFWTGLVALGVLLLLQIPWLYANPPARLSTSNSAYTDEGLYNSSARDLVLFGSFGHEGLFRELTNSTYTMVDATVFAVFGPSIVAARAVSVVSLCLMVVVVLWGLWDLIGSAGAVVVAAGIGGSQLMLLYGHIGIVEPVETMLLVSGFVLVARATASRNWLLGVVGGLVLAAAVGAKESALLALPGILGVPLVAGAVSRQWRRLLVPAAATASVAVAIGVWFLVVALPNRADLDAALSTFSSTSTSIYPHSFGGAMHRLAFWLENPGATSTDHVMPWSEPLLIAVAVGILGLLALHRRAGRRHFYVSASGLLWAAVCWAVPVLGAYSPNRYMVVAVPGLALAAGPGLGLLLEWPAALIHHRLWSGAAQLAVAALIAVPGVASYLSMEAGQLGTDQLSADQAAVARVLPADAVLFGVYGPDLAMSDRVHLVIPWVQSGLHMSSPVTRYGVNYVIVDMTAKKGGGDAALLRAVSSSDPVRNATPLVVVPWGPHRLAVYSVASLDG